MSQITLQQVAREAGVSISTVSRVLNKVATPIDLSAATVERVRRVAGELGYVPSGAARAMRTGKSRTLGILGTSSEFFGNVRSSFVGEIMGGLVEAATQCGYHLSLLTGFQPSSDGQMADFGMVDGLLALNRDLANDATGAAALTAWPKPLVYALDYPEAGGSWAIAPDDEQGGRIATRALLDAGHQRIAWVKRNHFAGIFGRREAGWRAALSEFGFTSAPVWDVDTLTPQMLSDLVATGVSAALCANPPVGEQLWNLAEEAGLRVPEDLALVRFGQQEAQIDTQWAEVTHDLRGEMGAAVRLLVQLIEGDAPLVPRLQLFPYSFRAGASFPAP